MSLSIKFYIFNLQYTTGFGKQSLTANEVKHVHCLIQRRERGNGIYNAVPVKQCLSILST